MTPPNNIADLLKLDSSAKSLFKITSSKTAGTIGPNTMVEFYSGGHFQNCPTIPVANQDGSRHTCEKNVQILSPLKPVSKYKANMAWMVGRWFFHK